MKSNDEFVVGRKYQTKHGGEGLCVGFTSEGPPILQFSESYVQIITDIDRWEEVKEPREFYIVHEERLEELFTFRTKQEALDFADLMDYPDEYVLRVREVV